MGCINSKKSSDVAEPQKVENKPAAQQAAAKPAAAPAAAAAAERKAEEKKAPAEAKADGKQERMSLEESTAETDRLYKQYRAEADKHAQLRGQYYEESKKAHAAGDGAKAKEFSEKAKEQGRLMEEASMKGARAIFSEKNKKQPEGTIDLHGLQVKEAELITTEELEKAKSKGAAQLKVIIGAGHHSDEKGPKVGPAVKKMLDERKTKWELDPTNASGGAIIVYL